MLGGPEGGLVVAGAVALSHLLYYFVWYHPEVRRPRRPERPPPAPDPFPPRPAPPRRRRPGRARPSGAPPARGSDGTSTHVEPGV